MITTTTQGMVEADRWKAVLRHIDELLCEIASGNQGSFKPKRGTISMANYALKVLREAYPTDEQLRAEAMSPDGGGGGGGK